MNQLSLSLMWFWVGVGSLGMAVGYFVGLSQSPVVATLLPLLFGLIGGSSGFIITRTRPDEPESIKILKYSGIGFFVFSIAVIGSSFVALNVKVGSGQAVNQRELPLDGVASEMGIKIVAVRKQLQILDASEKEQSIILQSALRGKITKVSTNKEIEQYLGNLAAKSDEAAQVIKSALEKGTVQVDEEDKLKILLVTLKAVGPIFKHWIISISSNKVIPAMAISKILTTLSDNLGKLIGCKNRVALATISKLSHDPDLLRTLLELQAVRWNNVPILKVSSASGLPNLDFEVDELIKLLLTQKGANQHQKTQWFSLAYKKALPSGQTHLEKM